MKIKILAMLLVLLAFPATWLLSGDLNRIALFNAYGQKTSGHLAGVRIGQTRDEAIAQFLRMEMISATYADDGSCPLRGSFDGALVFLDTSWRRGTICVGLREGRVSAFAWRYNFFQP
jgi:hypothetical protein